MDSVKTIAHNNPKFSSKIAGFDLDFTLIQPVSHHTFSKDKDDFEIYNPLVMPKLQQLHNEDYLIVIITNQSRIYKHELIDNWLETINIPLVVIIGTKKNKKNLDTILRKPDAKLFNKLFEVFPDKKLKDINKKESFYVGDAGNKLGDFADTDLVFAKNIGFKFIHTRDYFVRHFIYDDEHIDTMKKTMILMMGFPASGKSTYAEEIIDKNPNIFTLINGDAPENNTKVKMKKNILKAVNDNQNIIIDATNVSIEKRDEHLHLVKSNINYQTVIIYIMTPMDASMKRNEFRAQQTGEKAIPKIAYYKLAKSFESPRENEADYVYYV